MEVIGGVMAVWWPGRLPLGKNRAGLGVGSVEHVELSVSNTGEQSWSQTRLSRLPSEFGLLHQGII